MEELKECPFCGSSAQITRRSKGVRVECKERWQQCLINMRTHHFASDDEAINAWNKRFKKPE